MIIVDYKIEKISGGKGQIVSAGGWCWSCWCHCSCWCCWARNNLHGNAYCECEEEL